MVGRVNLNLRSQEYTTTGLPVQRHGHDAGPQGTWSPEGLPEGWAACFDDASQRFYYWHRSDRSKPQWRHPRETEVAVKVEPASCDTESLAETGLPDDWEEHETDDGHLVGLEFPRQRP